MVQGKGRAAALCLWVTRPCHDAAPSCGGDAPPSVDPPPPQRSRSSPDGPPEGALSEVGPPLRLPPGWGVEAAIVLQQRGRSSLRRRLGLWGHLGSVPGGGGGAATVTPARTSLHCRQSKPVLSSSSSIVIPQRAPAWVRGDGVSSLWAWSPPPHSDPRSGRR